MQEKRNRAELAGLSVKLAELISKSAGLTAEIARFMKTKKGEAAASPFHLI
jgi:hypothetical protein